MPQARGRVWVPPALGEMARFTSGNEKLALSAP
jgi:hypothetical protein